MKRNSSFIPSPYKVVTSYENTLIKNWNDNAVKMTSEILKYVAKSTAKTIKEIEDGI